MRRYRCKWGPMTQISVLFLKELRKRGRVSLERIDDAVRRVLRLKYRLGLFDTLTHIHVIMPTLHHQNIRL